MGPQSEGRPSEETAEHANHTAGHDTTRNERDRKVSNDLARLQLDRLDPSTVDSRAPASPATSTNGRERDLKGKGSEQRDRSKPRSHRKGSGQLRICRKCQEPLTGQFVRALGGTFHLDCFKCKVIHCFTATSSKCIRANIFIGLRSDSCLQVLSCRR